jgi:starvation-inducible outer membrane lipoprotein
MNKKILLIILLLVSICLSGCTSKPEPIEYEIIKVDVVEATNENSIQKYDFDIVYVDDKGYIQYTTTSEYHRDIVRLKQSDDDKYRLFYLQDVIGGYMFELHIPKNII